MYTNQNAPIYSLEVKGNRPPMLITIIVGFFAAIGLLMPIVMLGVIASFGEGFKLGFFIGAGAFFAVGYYLLRMVSWNYNGLEIIEVREEEVVYRARTKFLSLETHTLKVTGCILIQRDIENGTANYFLRNNDQVVEMKFRAAIADLNRLEEILYERNV